MIYTKDIIKSRPLNIAQTTQYVASNVICIIDKFTLTNTGANSVTVTINLIPNGDAPSVDNAVMFSRIIGVGEAYTCPEIVGHVLSSGSYISTSANNTGIVVRASGREIS